MLILANSYFCNTDAAACVLGVFIQTRINAVLIQTLFETNDNYGDNATTTTLCFTGHRLGFIISSPLN